MTSLLARLEDKAVSLRSRLPIRPDWNFMRIFENAYLPVLKISLATECKLREGKRGYFGIPITWN
jgi:hypothetical protein